MSETNDYYGIEIAEVSKCNVEEKFYLQDLKQRKLYLTGEIDEYIIDSIVRHILQYNSDDKDISVSDRKPILLYISSNGGSVDPGFELIDVILASKTPVYTINLGYLYSMGFLIGLAGHKRYASRFAKFLMHDGTNVIINSSSKVQDQIEFNRRLEDRIRDYVLERSKITAEEYDSKLRIEWYLFSDEAKEKGFVDYIIGHDCALDDII